MAGAFDAKVDISTKEAVDGLQNLRKEAGLLGTAMQQLDGILKASNGNLKEAATSFTALVAAQRQAASASKELAQSRIAGARAAGQEAQNTQRAGESTARQARDNAAAALSQDRRTVAAQRASQIEEQRTAAQDRSTASTQRAAQSSLELTDNLSNSRYLMYDVGATYMALSAALMTIPTATAAVAASYQRDFAQVLRVTEHLDQMQGGAQGLKNSLKDLAVALPVGFDELTRITQLGAQMGVAKEKLVEFTETTAKFVAVTGISADAGSQLFGRLETSFTDDVAKFPDFFNRVGSSIANVGAKTVATDPEIASMLNQIGSLGAAAGMTAADTTGLAAALASVRVQPELARGTLTRIFGQLNRDVAEGSPRLAEYGKLMGNISGKQAGELWKTDSAEFFQKMAKGLNDIHVNGGNLTGTLDKLGIKASRDVSAITKLAVGYDVLDKSMTEANKGFSEGSALDDMSKISFDTVIAKLTEMGNAWKNLGDSIGSVGLGPLAAFVDMGKNVAVWLRGIVDGVPAVGVLIAALMGLAGVTAVFLGFKAAQAFVIAGLIGFQQASARGIGSAMNMSGVLRQAAQTMLIMKGATEAQSRALLQGAGAYRAMSLAAASSSAQLRAMQSVSNNLDTTGQRAVRAAGGIRGFAGSLLSMAGGPIGIALIALSLLAGGFINSAVEAETAGKAIAESMKQGSEAGLRSISEQFAKGKAPMESAELAFFGGIGQKYQDMANEAGIGWDKVIGAIAKGKDAQAEFNRVQDEFAVGKGFKDFNDYVKNASDPSTVARLTLLETGVKNYGNEWEKSAGNAKSADDALAKLGVTTKGTGGVVEEETTNIDEMTKALKNLNDEIFGTINAEANLQDALAKVGEGLQKSGSYSPMDEGGRDNLKNLEEGLSKGRDYYNQLYKENSLSAQEAAAGYAEFVQGLMDKIHSLGGDTSAVDALATSTKGRFAAILGADPATIPVKTDASQLASVATALPFTMQAYLDTQTPPTLGIGVATDEAQSKLIEVAQSLSVLTGIPYTVVLDALTNPANDKAKEVYDVLTAVTDGTYVAPIGADTSVAISNVQNFSNYARTELANLQAQYNRILTMSQSGQGFFKGAANLGLGKNFDGTGEQTYFGPNMQAAPAQAPVQAAPKVAAPNFGGLDNGYNKAADAAKKAGDAGKKAGKDMANGIDEATAAAEDYANRLKTALTSAFNQQYGLTIATDEYHTALNAITKKREDELEQLKELRASVKALRDERDKELISAGKAKIEAGISAKYGEVGRQADYENQAQTALDNAAAKQKDIDANIKQTNTLADGIGALTGYSDAAIANRAALRDLEMKALDMVTAYAATGASTDQVRAYAQNLTAQWQRDVAQMGLNMSTIGQLQGSLQRYTDAINRVPYRKQTDMAINTNGAEGALNALNAASDWAARPRTVVFDADAEALKRKMNEAFRQFESIFGPSGKSAQLFAAQNGGDGYNAGGLVFNRGGSVPGFASGGLIPGTPPANPRTDNLMAKVDGKGMIRVRSREYIQPQEAVDYYGMDFMNAIRTLSLPKFSTGGAVSGGGSSAGASVSGSGIPAELVAAIQRLADRPVQLFTEDRVIAESASRGNTVLASTGSN